MKYTILVPGTRAQLTLVQPRFDWRNKDHTGADGIPLDEAALMALRIAQVQAQLIKCTGKHKKHVLRGGVSRRYPMYGECMDTASYVRWFYQSNFGQREGNQDHKNFFEPLSTNPQAWPDEPLHEIDA